MIKFLPICAIATMAFVLGASSHSFAANGVCNNTDTVGGGTLTPSPSSGAGWDVGGGQCNGDFTIYSDPSFPSSSVGDGIELGMRIEQRRVGPVNFPDHSGNDYKVETGHDTTTPAPDRAWWNFQHSIAYDGNINDLDALTFIMRKDAGSSVPVGPVDMLAIGGIIGVPNDGINDRNDALGTTTYSGFYQTSQNPVFGWLSSYDMSEEGAWYLTLAALEDGVLADVSICVHTPGEECGVAPVVYTCSAFEAPIPADASIALKKKQNRVLPLKMVCTDSGGNILTGDDISPPIVQVQFNDGINPPADESGDILESGKGTDGNEFVSTDGTWNFNLQTKPHSASGTYVVSVVASGGDVLMASPTALFTRP